MNKSTKSARPRKPRPDFPLFPHATKRWAKKIRGKLHYFGPWDDPQGALNKYLDQKDDLYAGRTPRVQGEGYTVQQLVNEFLTSKRLAMDMGELTARSWRDYYHSCDRVVGAFGRSRLVADLGRDDFERLKASLPGSPITVGNEANRIKVVFNWAFEERKIDKPPHFGKAFGRPSKKVLRLEGAKKGPRMFEASDIRQMIEAASKPMKAMLLLGINAALSNTDLANIEKRHLDLAGGWLAFPRPKTGSARKCRLWSETIEALQASIRDRPQSKHAADSECVFLSQRGERLVRIAQQGDKAGVKIDVVAREFANLLRSIKLDRKGIGFYGLRHTFETVAGEGRDQVAVDMAMGHADPSMGATYRERISDERLTAVADVVHAWLWPAPEHGETPGVIPFKANVG